MQTKISWIIAGTVGVVGLGATAAFATVAAPIDQASSVTWSASPTTSAVPSVDPVKPVDKDDAVAEPVADPTTVPTVDPTTTPTTVPRATPTTVPRATPITVPKTIATADLGADPTKDPKAGCDGAGTDPSTAATDGDHGRHLWTGTAAAVQASKPIPVTLTPADQRGGRHVAPSSGHGTHQHH